MIIGHPAFLLHAAGVRKRYSAGVRFFQGVNRSLFDQGFIFSGFTFLARVGEQANYSDEKPQITPSILRKSLRCKVKRNPLWAEAILRSYARNICQLTEVKSIYKDAKTETNMAESTFFDYLEALQKLYILEDVEAWCPSIRSKTAIRSARKKNFVDPSLAVAAMGVGPAYFDKDYRTLGFLFESLVIRDLRIYSSEHGGRVSYYHDRYGLEADAVLHLEDGRYALIEVKLGQSEIEDGARHLCEIERLIAEHNKDEKQVPLRLPDLKIVITGTKYGYVRPDGVYVIPIGC